MLLNMEKESDKVMDLDEDEDDIDEIDDLDDFEDDDLDAGGDDDSTEAKADGTNAKKYDDKELDEIVSKRLAREKRKFDREKQELEGKLNSVLNTIKAGTGTETPEEGLEYLTDYWKGQGVQIPEHEVTEPTNLSDKQIKLLAEHDVQEIIDVGFEEVVYEVDRLASKGVDNMTPMELEKFKLLAQHREDQENAMELEKLGVKENIFEDPDFKEFRAKFSNKTPVSEVYDYYARVKGIKPQEDFEIMGSQKSNVQVKVKEYYTDEEIDNLTDKDLDNPVVMDAVLKSMEINYRKRNK